MPDTTEIERALDALLHAVLHHEANKPPATGSLRATVFKWHGDAPIPTREECQLAGILRDPVRGALDLAIRRLGERLFELTGSIGGMREVAERVADLDPPSGTRVASREIKT